VQLADGRGDREHRDLDAAAGVGRDEKSRRRGMVIASRRSARRRGTALFGGLVAASAVAGALSPVASASSVNVAITATYMNSGTYNLAAASLVPPFEKATGAKVNIEAFPYAALQTNNTNAVISGQCTYNVVSGSYYLAALYPYFANLDSFAAKSNYAAQLLPGLWQHSEYYDGYHVGVPYGPDSYSFMYNSALFKQAGLSIPTTQAQLLSDLAALKTKLPSGVSPFVFSAGASEQLPALFFESYSGYFINKAGHYALDPAAAVSALKGAEQLMSYAPSDATGLSINAADDLFVNGKAAVLYGWPSFIRLQADNPAESKIAGHWEVGTDPSGGMIWLSLWQMYMTKCTSDQALAWKWMTTFSSPKTDELLFTKYDVNPSFKATYANPVLAKQNANYFPGEEANLPRAKNPPLTGEAQDFLASTIGSMLTSKLTPQAAVSSINSEWAHDPVPPALLSEGATDGLVQK
jgi:multiple sugar transport system substrate-binding protein